MKYLRPAISNKFKYTHLVGTGGIGSGMFFKLAGDHTLGRNESRLAELVPFKDYCKLHIIAHYTSIMLNAHPGGNFEVFPIGKIGNDETGRSIFNEMKNAGMSMEHVTFTNEARTLFSVCYQYPDSTGGNITTLNSASNMVSPNDIDLFFSNFHMPDEGELILAAPEVPVETRIRLLEKGRQRKSFNVASLLSSEVKDIEKLEGFEKIDLLSVNIDEAGAIAGIDDVNLSSRAIVELCVKRLSEINPGISVAITDGPKGCYGYKQNCLEYIPCLSTNAVGTGGAGDAFLAGVISGLCCGLPFLKGRNDKTFGATPLESAIELGTLLASLSVTSPDTIHQTADAQLLSDYSKEKHVSFSRHFADMFADCNDSAGI